MNAFKILPAERFLGRLSGQPGSPISHDDGDELREDDVLWSSDFSSKPSPLSSPLKTSFLKPISSSSFSSSSGARMIPNIPKPRAVDAPLSSPGGRMVRQSAPVNVPAAGGRRRGSEEEEMLPPHEMVARKKTPAAALSVLEGAGRTLKGRDLSRMRNAVWRQTGFMD